MKKNNKIIFLAAYIFTIFFYICFFCSCGKAENRKETAEINNETPGSSRVPAIFNVKTAPIEISIKCDGEIVNSPRDNSGIRTIVSASENEIFEFSSSGYVSQYIKAGDIPSLLRKGALQIKLEPETAKLKLLQEINTGSKPKSVVFSDDGKRVFVPLLDETGVDVFSFSVASKELSANKESSANKDSSEGKDKILKFEKRLKVPGKNLKGFVEGLIDKTRNEFWVSNMNDNCVHIFDSKTLAYKTSVPTEGKMSKVIAQSHDGKIVIVSNWHSQDISFISAEYKKLLFKVSLGSTPRGMVFSPDNSYIYATIFDEPVIAVIDIYKRKIVKQFNLYDGNGALRHVLYHNKRLYVSDMARGRLNIIDEESGKLIKSAYVGSNLNTIVFSPDKKLIFVSSRGKNNPEDYIFEGPEFGSVSMLSADTLSLLGRVWGRNQPTGLDVSPDGRHMIFSDFLDANLELYEIEK